VGDAVRIKVRTIEPRVDGAELEELGGRPSAARPRPVTAADLGPNGEAVLDVLRRAARMTPAERRSLDKATAWRWWMMTPLPGATMPAARAHALIVGRADGRSDAIVALQGAVAAIVTSLVGAKAGRSRLPACVSNAGLALLVRDLIEPEVFETLIGPWREVMRD
jgi:hypothetical protein